MTVQTSPLTRELAAHLVAHLDELGVAIRARDVAAVLRHTGTLEAEQTFRGTLEDRRGALLHRGARLLGVEPWEVTVTALCTLLEPESAEVVRARSDELLRATEDVAREHRTNRTLMQQELSFLDHLLRLGGAPPEPTYAPPGAGSYRAGGGPSAAIAAGAGAHRHGLDLRA
jgi:hypothetical protein